MNRDLSSGLLGHDEGTVVSLVNPAGSAPILLVCEHASSYIPTALNDLGLSSEARYAHIAWDIGAADLAHALSRQLNAPLVTAGVSRLVYDCNRPLDDPTATPATSEVFDVPGNQALTQAQRQQRYDEIYLPFEQMVTQQIDKLSQQLPEPSGIAAQWRLPLLVSVHSFTPVYHGVTRQAQIGLLHDEPALSPADHCQRSRLADTMNAAAHTRVHTSATGKNAPSGGALQVALNVPYSAADGVMHTLKLHARPRELDHVMIEVNNAFIRDASSVDAVALQLSGLINLALEHGPHSAQTAR